jgi:CTP synthase
MVHFVYQHAAIECKRCLDLIWIEAEHLERDSNVEFNQEQYDSAWEKLRKADGVIVPGGFGKRYLF